jgi:hypothetical protein
VALFIGKSIYQIVGESKRTAPAALNEHSLLENSSHSIHRMLLGGFELSTDGVSRSLANVRAFIQKEKNRERKREREREREIFIKHYSPAARLLRSSFFLR